MRRLPFAAFLMVCAALAGAQLEAPKPSPLVGARSLALSPDGTQIAFSYQGDVWVAPAAGGKAVPITNHVEMDDNPLWSPDGKFIAFSSNRNGSNDIYVVPAEGGQTQRLTYHPGNDIPSDWSPDGKTILTKVQRDDRYAGMYTIDVKTGKNEKIFLDFMSTSNPNFSADGKSIIYNRLGFPWYRARYEGTNAAELWRYDMATGKRSEIKNDRFQHLWPTVNAQGIYNVTVTQLTPSSSPVNKPIPKFVDNEKRTPNVYWTDYSGNQKQLTHFVGAPVHFLTAAKKTNLVAFEEDGDVYTMVPGQEPKKIAITAVLDDKTTQQERLVLTNGVDDATFSPKSDKVIFQVRGELWMVPTKKDDKSKSPNKDDATQLTDWEGTDEQPLWTPDEKTIFFVSDRNGAERLFKMDVETKAVTPITLDDADVSVMRLTPDKQKVSFWKAGKDGGLYTVPVSGGTPTQVLSRPGSSHYYAWSPDMRYVAYSEDLQRSGYYYWDSTSNVYIYDVAGKKSTNVTQLSAEHVLPQFSPDGNYLFFRSNRSGAGLYVLPLDPEDARETELDVKYVKPTAPVKVDINWEDIESRIRKVSAVQPEGEILIDPEKGDIYYLSGGDIYKSNYNGDEGKKITGGGGFSNISFSEDGKLIVGIRNGMPTTVDFNKPNNEIATVTFRADWTRDVKKEREAAYNEFWRTYNNGFYDGNFHSRDWTMLRERYRKLLPSISHRNEMATVLNMLVGELESSHSEVGPAPGNPGGQSVAHLGFTYDYSYNGPGIKILEVPAKTPGSYSKTKLESGEIVTKVNGKPVALNEALYRDVLIGEDGRDITLTVQGKDGKTREVKYRAMSPGAFSGIVWNNMLEARRKYVEEKSHGMVTYVQIGGMGQPELDRFNQQVWMYASGKKALIIDVRNNGGGNTADRIIDVLERAPNMIYKARDEESILGPGQALAMPMVVMCNESSFSNAEMFPAAMQARKLATLVGHQTPGYVIYTGGGRLVDGTSIRMPGTGVYHLDGSPLEDNGVMPDYIVDQSVEDFFAGRDPQLDKSIEVLMKQIK